MDMKHSFFKIPALWACLMVALVAVSCSESGNSAGAKEESVSKVKMERDDHLGMVHVLSAGAVAYLGTNDAQAKSTEKPYMKVNFTYDFFLDRHEVTCLDFNAMMKKETGLQVDCPKDSMPAGGMTFLDAVLYANAKSKSFGKDTSYTYTSAEFDGEKHCVKLDGFAFNPEKSGFRLPTEAEWVLAASQNWNPARSWNGENSDGKFHEVCTAAESHIYFCDLAGNMLEWVNDWQGNFREKPVTNFVGAVDGGSLGSCVVKGGSVHTAAEGMNLYSRGDTYPVLYSSRADYVGFRLAYGAIPDGEWLSRKGDVNVSPVVPLMGRSELLSLTQSSRAKLAFRNEETGNLAYVSYAGEKPVVVEIEDSLSVYHPEISPNGSHVAFCTFSEGVLGQSQIYVRDLDRHGSNLVKLDVKSAAIPRWRVTPDGDTLLVYVSSAADNRGDDFLERSTWQVSFSRGKFGKPEKLFDGAYHGGVSEDRSLAVTGARLLRARIADGKSSRDTVWYDGAQACNVSLARDQSKRTLFLDFGGKPAAPFSGERYGVHEQLLMADSVGKIIQMIPSPDGYAFDHSEWVGGFINGKSNLAVVSLTNANGAHQKIALVNVEDSTISNLLEGNELWHPSLWIQQETGTESLVDYDSAGVYFVNDNANPFAFSSVELGMKLQSFWKIRDEVEFVTLGSSMLMDAVIDDSVKTFKSLNMGVTLSDVYLFDYIVRYYLLPYATKLKAIAIELSPGMLYRSRDEMMVHLVEYSPGLQYDENHLNVKTVASIADNSLDLEYPTDLFAQQYMEGTFLLPSVSWNSPSVAVDTSIMKLDDPNVKETLRIFQSIKALADSNGIILVAAITPQNPKYRETGTFNTFGPSRTVARQLIQKIKDMDILVFDENKDGDHDYTDEMAFNTNHLSYLGAAQFSARLDALLDSLSRK